MASPEEILKKTTEVLRLKAKQDKVNSTQTEWERRELVASIGKEIAGVIGPVLLQMVEQQKKTAEMTKSMLQDIKVVIPPMPELKMPEIVIPPINVPRPNVTVNVPKSEMPRIDIPAPQVNIPDTMKVSMEQYSHNAPLPVMMMDVNGKPMSFSMGAGGGGKADFFTIKGFSQSAFSELVNADNRLRVSVETGGSGLTDAELRATAVPVSQVSGHAWSTVVTEIFGSLASNLINPDNRLKVELPSGASGLTDSELRATAVPVSQVSGANWSTSVTNTVTMTPITVRGSRATAYATMSSDAVTTLISGVAATYLDLIYVMAANQSTGTVTLDFACGTSGTTILSLQVPATSTAGVAPATAIPMPELAQPWIVRFANSDTTGTTVDVTALFERTT